MLVDSNKIPNLLKTKEIYYYNITDYSEDNSITVTIIAGSYTLGITHITSKITKGL